MTLEKETLFCLGAAIKHRNMSSRKVELIVLMTQHCPFKTAQVMNQTLVLFMSLALIVSVRAFGPAAANFGRTATNQHIRSYRREAPKMVVY